MSGFISRYWTADGTLQLHDAPRYIRTAEIERGTLARKLFQVARLVEYQYRVLKVHLCQRGLPRIPIEQVIVWNEYQFGILQQRSGMIEGTYLMLPPHRDQILHVQHRLFVLPNAGSSGTNHPFFGGRLPHSVLPSRPFLEGVSKHAFPLLAQFAAAVVDFGGSFLRGGGVDGGGVAISLGDCWVDSRMDAHVLARS